MQQSTSPALPSLRELGKDLLIVTPWHVALSLLRPIFCFALFWPLAVTHHYVLAAIAAAGLLFFTYTSTSHDLVHRTLHLPHVANELLLFALEAITLRSGHAFRITHLQHHRHFPDADDIEGAEAAKGLWSALASGPLHQIRLFIWAWRQGAAAERRWMLAEAACIMTVLIATALLWRQLPALPVYVAFVILGSWIYPFATVWLPHRASGKTPLEQTRAFRGRLVPLLFFEHTYHLEHHLYPGVSSHRWAELARRLEPHFQEAGVEVVRLP